MRADTDLVMLILYEAVSMTLLKEEEVVIVLTTQCFHIHHHVT